MTYYYQPATRLQKTKITRNIYTSVKGKMVSSGDSPVGFKLVLRINISFLIQYCFHITLLWGK